MERIVIKCNDGEDVKERWMMLKAQIDPNGDHEEVLDKLLTYFEEGDGTVEGVHAANEKPRFR